MKTRIRHRLGTIWLAAALIGFSCTPVQDAQPGSQSGDVPATAVFADDGDPALAALPFVEDELLVQPYPGADATALADLYDDAGATLVDELDEIQLAVLEVSPGDAEAAANRLANSGLIEAIHRNYIYEAAAAPNDPLYRRQGHLPQVNAPEAWDITVGAEDILVAIVDTGCDTEHPDLADKIAGSWNIFDGNDDVSDEAGHGTQVAGVAAASSDNGTGVAGVAWGSPILIIRATNDEGRTSSKNLAAAILWAVGRGAKVINVSFAPLWSNTVVRSAAEQAFNRGALVVISSGNSGRTHSATGYDRALFVGAIDAGNRIASFSDRGPFVDLVAPGTGVWSTGAGSGYRSANGTSFAAPIISGIAALAWSVNPDLRPLSIMDALLDTTRDLGTRGKDSTYGYGAVDAAAAVDTAMRTTFIPDNTAPSLRIRRPSSGARVSSRTVAWVTATDKTGVADVVLSIDGVPVATDTRAAYRFVIDPADFSPGTHELAFVATDVAGNASAPETVTVKFGGSSADGASAAIEFTFPADGARISRDVTIQADVSAEAGLATVEWLVDGTFVFVSGVSGRSAGVSYLWRAGSATKGTHTITLIITDLKGNQTTRRLELVRR